MLWRPIIIWNHNIIREAIEGYPIFYIEIIKADHKNLEKHKGQKPLEWGNNAKHKTFFKNWRRRWGEMDAYSIIT